MATENVVAGVKLAEEEIDDILFFARAGQLEELQETFDELCKKHSSAERSVDELKENIIKATRNETGNTALHYCCANGHKGVADYLIPSSSLSTLLAQNEAGNTPLHWAALNGHVEVVQSLVDAIEKAELSQDAAKLSVSEEQPGAAFQAPAEAVPTAAAQQEQASHAASHDPEDPPPPPPAWDIRNKAGRGPMSEAQLNSQEKVVQFLLERMVVGSNQNGGSRADGESTKEVAPDEDVGEEPAEATATVNGSTENATSS
ncbi:ankyrin [Tilletiaria anomala UBC 951]|uniref:Ankyrin n=1 Tax=Tilletiaria anomala (strain ATCC 24038 / CBS 436.72 / UBC 951) TaxID=1037660 RepID=A0A066VYN5_TILAU|nr:ankyrin [Tilletiaria anomala UBC 951]KDN43665.1 ankyrin [Tilletiaria anomala UBC 951]